jgi:hypothetical protein
MEPASKRNCRNPPSVSWVILTNYLPSQIVLAQLSAIGEWNKSDRPIDEKTISPQYSIVPAGT